MHSLCAFHPVFKMLFPPIGLDGQKIKRIRGKKREDCTLFALKFIEYLYRKFTWLCKMESNHKKPPLPCGGCGLVLLEFLGLHKDFHLIEC